MLRGVPCARAQWHGAVSANSCSAQGSSPPSLLNTTTLLVFLFRRQAKHELPDGRHRIEWFLIDEADDEHLAIVGEEKETRDGHYLYRTQGVFDTALPLQVRVGAKLV